MRLIQIITAVLVVGGLAAAGCGGGSSTQTIRVTQTQTQTSASAPASSAASQAPIQPPPSSIKLSALGLPPRTQGDYMPLFPAHNTCDGANTWLPYTWSEVPSDAAELALFIVNIRPVNRALFVDWAVAGLSPSSHGLPAGSLPSGAVVGRNSFGQVGYSICPPKGTSEVYVARLVALSRPLHPKSGFDANAFYVETEHASKAVGITGAGRYVR